MNRKFKTGVATLLIITVCAMATTPVSAQTHPKKAIGKKAAGPAKPSAADLAQGQALVSKSDCLTCHKLDIKLVGPAYKDVAAKYPPTEANCNMLAQKIIGGGSGTWGAVAMAPHPALAQADVKKMVQYILSIK